MSTSIHFGPNDRGPDGKILTLDQLLADSRQAMSAAEIAADPPAAPAAKKPASKAEQVFAIVALIMLVVAVYRFSAGGDAAPAAAPVASAPATQPTSAPTPTPAPPTAALLPAYSAPDAPLGQIEATRAITPVAHFGPDWIQAIVQGSGKVWLRASDWPALAIVGPDLAPPTPAPYVPPPHTATPAPPPCAESGIPGKMVQVCGYDSLESLQQQAKEQWIATYGGNVGIVTTPTPQEWNKP